MQSLNQKEIKHNLNCCAKGSGEACKKCSMDAKLKDSCECAAHLAKQAYSLVSEYEKEIKRLNKLCALRERDLYDTQDLLYAAEKNPLKLRDMFKERIKGIYLDEYTANEIIDEITEELLNAKA